MQTEEEATLDQGVSDQAEVASPETNEEVIESTEATDQQENNYDDIPDDPRAAEMERRAAMFNGQVADEPEATAGEGEPAEEQAADEPPAAHAAPVFTGEDGEYYTTVKVDGEEQTIKYEDMRRSFQKDAAGDKKLAQAAERVNQLKQWETDLQQRESNLQQQPSSDVAESALPDEGVQSPEKIAELIAAMKDAAVYDDEDAQEKATALMTDFLSNKTALASNQPPQPQIDPTQIAATVKQDLQREQAIDSVRNDDAYRDLFTDPATLAEMDGYSGELIRTNPELSIAENLRQAGDMVRERAARIAGVNTPANELDSRRQQKQAMATRQVTAGSQRAQVSVPAPQVETPEQIRAEMRRERGLTA